jgi:hypothetical protein
VKENKAPQVPNDPAILGVSSTFPSNSKALLARAIKQDAWAPYVMKHFGCKVTFVLRERKPHVEISVAFLLIIMTRITFFPQCLNWHALY